MAESSPNGWKTLWEKEKLLVTSNFSFAHIVIKRLVLQISKNKESFLNGLKTEKFEKKKNVPGKNRILKYVYNMGSLNI